MGFFSFPSTSCGRLWWWWFRDTPTPAYSRLTGWLDWLGFLLTAPQVRFVISSQAKENPHHKPIRSPKAYIKSPSPEPLQIAQTIYRTTYYGPMKMFRSSDFQEFCILVLGEEGRKKVTSSRRRAALAVVGQSTNPRRSRGESGRASGLTPVSLCLLSCLVSQQTCKKKLCHPSTDAYTRPTTS